MPDIKLIQQVTRPSGILCRVFAVRSIPNASQICEAVFIRVELLSRWVKSEQESMNKQEPSKANEKQIPAPDVWQRFDKVVDALIRHTPNPLKQEGMKGK